EDVDDDNPGVLLQGEFEAADPVRGQEHLEAALLKDRAGGLEDPLVIVDDEHLAESESTHSVASWPGKTRSPPGGCKRHAMPRQPEALPGRAPGSNIFADSPPFLSATRTSPYGPTPRSGMARALLSLGHDDSRAAPAQCDPPAAARDDRPRAPDPGLDDPGRHDPGRPRGSGLPARACAALGERPRIELDRARQEGPGGRPGGPGVRGRAPERHG